MPRFSILPPRFSACRSGRLLALAACLAAAQAQAGIEYSVDIDAPSDLAQLLRDNLELVEGQKDPDVDPGWLDALVKSTPDEAKKLLETEAISAPGWTRRWRAATGCGSR